jgi:hypothetical protein
MISKAASIIESWIDEYIDALQFNKNIKRKNVKTVIDFYGVKPREAKEVSLHFEKMLDEINSVIERSDEDLVEGWSYLNMTKLKRLQNYLELIVDEFKTRGTIKRRKKKISPEKLVKSVKYMVTDKELGESIEPQNIIGARGVLLYNIKQKKISFYSSENGLSVQGTTLKNFDKAIVKKCGRKPSTWIKELTSYAINRMINEINNLKATQQQVTGRINKDTLIMRIIK